MSFFMPSGLNPTFEQLIDTIDTSIPLLGGPRGVVSVGVACGLPTDGPAIKSETHGERNPHTPDGAGSLPCSITLPLVHQIRTLSVLILHPDATCSPFGPCAGRRGSKQPVPNATCVPDVLPISVEASLVEGNLAL